MLRSDPPAAALSPVLLLGFALHPVPGPVLQAVASLAMAAMVRRHRPVFERLDGLKNPHFLIEPLDLPIRFLLSVAPPSARLTVLGDEQDSNVEPAATIRGPMRVLIDLLEGRIDGDALFFSRALSVEGDMAAVVALRNAVDGAEISLIDDLTRPLGPLGGPARGLARLGAVVYRRAEQDMDMLRNAALAPVARRCDAQAGRLRELDKAVSSLASRKQERRA